ncbi:calmodulin-related [Euphorbia peplus]|nr:calmodulin-related [Euphorbia peplus]
MAKEDLSDSESEQPDEKFTQEEEEEEEEEEDDDDDDDDDDEEEEQPRKMAKQVMMPDYEKQRVSRMAENKARMEALGLRKMATAVMDSPQKSNHSLVSTARKGKRKIIDEDDDYRPNDDVSADDLDDDDDDEDADSSVRSSAKSRRRKPQKKVAAPKKKLLLRKHAKSRDYINEDDDEELMKAISLSLQDLPEKKNPNVRDGAGGRKKPPLSSRVKMTEDELILHFFQFDASGKGFLTLRDLQRVSSAHDFLWTDEELADMITLFDSDGDGKLNLDDFRKIARRCSMI